MNNIEANNKAFSYLDYANFFTRYRSHDGQLISRAVFDEQLFAAIFGEDLAMTAKIYLYYNDKTDKTIADQNSLAQAEQNLRKNGINPQELMNSRDQAVIEQF